MDVDDRDAKSPAQQKTMTESEPIRITPHDIAEANRLSLSCPICAGAVEDNVDNRARQALVCTNCQTLYHRNCWDQNGGRCAVLGCEHQEAKLYGTNLGPALKIEYGDLPRHVPSSDRAANGRERRLKRKERRLQRERANRDFWGDLLRRMLRAFGWR